MKSYYQLLKKVLNEGKLEQNSNNNNYVFLTAEKMEFDLKKGFPILTKKKINFKNITSEMVWFLNGKTNIRDLVLQNNNMWNEWVFEKYQNSKFYNNETLEQFISQVKDDEEFANKFADAGKFYGSAWFDFNGINQITKMIKDLKCNPGSKRNIVSSWLPNELTNTLVEPCHPFFQVFITNKNELNMIVYLRNADMFLGVPYSISSYALLTFLIAHVCNLNVGKLIHFAINPHIFTEHISSAKEMLSRSSFKLPSLKIKKSLTELSEINIDDVEIINYKSHNTIKVKNLETLNDF